MSLSGQSQLLPAGCCSRTLTHLTSRQRGVNVDDSARSIQRNVFLRSAPSPASPGEGPSPADISHLAPARRTARAGEQRDRERVTREAGGGELRPGLRNAPLHLERERERGTADGFEPACSPHAPQVHTVCFPRRARVSGKEGGALLNPPAFLLPPAAHAIPPPYPPSEYLCN